MNYTDYLLHEERWQIPDWNFYGIFIGHTSPPPTRDRSWPFDSLLKVRHSLPTSTTLNEKTIVVIIFHCTKDLAPS